MNDRTWTIRDRDSGKTLADVVAAVLQLPRKRAVALLRQGAVRLGGQACRMPERIVRPGQRLSVTPTAVDKKPRFVDKKKPSPPRPEKPAKVDGVRIVHKDVDLIIVDKPAGVTTVRHADELAEAGPKARYLPPTLVDMLPGLVKGPMHGRFRIRAVHRLDRDTSGLVAFARSAEAESKLGKQFRAHDTDRTYIALVRGAPVEGRIESTLVRDRGDGRRGSGPGGQHAVTHVRVLETWPGYSLVECRLETGRTHQVRIHLGEAGTPLCGERVYDRPLHGKPLPDDSGAKRPMLHAASLALAHPTTGRRMSWTAEPAADFREV
ncbi:MAG TPA: RluA family pseudouridine synthase, partial [Gemmataceae bacterium]|nr:RluA family pseudouridine synthase [Gemmataceae bacterium]